MSTYTTPRRIDLTALPFEAVMRPHPDGYEVEADQPRATLQSAVDAAPDAAVREQADTADDTILRQQAASRLAKARAILADPAGSPDWTATERKVLLAALLLDLARRQR